MPRRTLPPVQPDIPHSEHQPIMAVFRRLGIHQNTGYALIKKGTFPIPLEKIGARYYCRRADVDAYLAPRSRP
jgi:predicted DNA-binding transcriptional regulator AlpA